MTSAIVEPIPDATKADADVLTKNGTAAIAGLQELAKAYQVLAAKNAAKLTTSIQALTAVQSPTEFIELQQKLIKEGIDAAVSDSGEIAKLTAALFVAACEPVQRQVEAMQYTVNK